MNQRIYCEETLCRHNHNGLCSSETIHLIVPYGAELECKEIDTR
jgi:hypothetical protein